MRETVGKGVNKEKYRSIQFENKQNISCNNVWESLFTITTIYLDH